MNKFDLKLNVFVRKYSFLKKSIMIYNIPL